MEALQGPAEGERSLVDELLGGPGFLSLLLRHHLLSQRSLFRQDDDHVVRCVSPEDSTLVMLSRVERSRRGGLERGLEGIVVVGVGMRASVCAMEAATWLIDDWSYFPCVLKGVERVSLVEESVLCGVDVVVTSNGGAI